MLNPKDKHIPKLVGLPRYKHRNLQDDMAKRVNSLKRVKIRTKPHSIEHCECGAHDNLLVHDGNPKDYTCGKCFEENQQTTGGSLKGLVQMKPVEQSTHPEHIAHVKKKEENKNLHNLLFGNVNTPLDVFKKTAPAHLKNQWFNMYSKKYSQNDNIYGPRDLDRLTYLMGVKHHEPEELNANHRANLIGLGIKHMHKLSNINSAKLPLEAFNTFEDLKGGLMQHPQVFKHLII